MTMVWNKGLGNHLVPNHGIDTAIEMKTTEIPSDKVPLNTLLKLNSNDTREFFCGWGSAMANVSVTFPLNKITFRQILEGVRVEKAVQQLSQEGIRLLYRGILPPLTQKTLSLSLMFSVYEGSRYRINILTHRPWLAKILAAHIAGTTEAILMPFERVQTLLQDWRYHKKFRNTSHAFRYLLSNYGIFECYRGATPIIYRNSLSNLMFFALRDEANAILGTNSHFKNFITGAVIGGLTSTVFYPMNVVKVHMQAKIGGTFTNFLFCLREVYVARNRSVLSFYKGMYINCLRSFIGWGVTNASYDFFKKLLF